MKLFRVKAISPGDGVVFLDYPIKSHDSQSALRDFVEMLDRTIGPDFHLCGEFNIEVRESERQEFPRAVTESGGK